MIRSGFNFLCTVFLVICLVFLPFASSGNVEASSGIKVKINDKFLSLPQAPLQVGETTLIPFRPIYEFLGATISWDEKTFTASAYRGNIKVVLQIKTGVAIVNDEKIILNVAPRIVNGSTMVPAWFFAESLGAQVDWDEKQKIINISLASVSGIDLETRELSLEQGETEIITATVLPDNAINKNIKWSSTQSSVANVQKASDTEAIVSAINPGTAIIIATTEEGNYVSTCKVEVKQAYTPVKGISLSRTTLFLVEGGAPTTLSATIIPEIATNKDITWKSSDTGVASIHKQTTNRGIIVPLKAGKTIISATTEDGEYEAICAVTVLSGNGDS